MPIHHPRRSHQQWQSYIKEFRNQNELNQRQFCEAEGLSLGTFRKHLYPASSKPKAARSTTNAGNFGPVTIRDTERLPRGVCLELPGNIRLHTQSLPSAEYLHNLVKVFGHGH